MPLITGEKERSQQFMEKKKKKQKTTQPLVNILEEKEKKKLKPVGGRLSKIPTLGWR